MQADFNSLRQFDFEKSTVHLWVFKKSEAAQKFKAKHAPIDGNLAKRLKHFGQREMVRITEVAPYTYLAQNNENSCLANELINTEFSLLKIQVDKPEPENLVSGLKDLKGSEGYVVKFINNGVTVYALKRSTTSWSTQYPKKFINMIFTNGELAAVSDNSFSIEQNFDLFCYGNNIFIANKRGFESALNHKVEYQQAFITLTATPQFSALFTDLAPLAKHVGTNSIQLRRMATIEQKGLYNRPNFLNQLQAVNINRAWGINFCPQSSKIIPCDQTVKSIMQVLLDHRLISEITNTTYDVPDAIQV